MLEYVKWRGDLSIAAVPLNEIDSLIFTQLSYLHFRDVVGSGVMPLREAAKLVEGIAREPGNAQIVADRHTLLAAVAQGKRFGDLSVCFCEDLFDAAREMQFAAITFVLPDGTHMVAYRGTDATVVGWKEDFNMSFSCPVPSQQEAVRYLGAVAGATHGPLRLCGHSKGGNLALYAATLCEPTTRARIAGIDLFDAPGLDAATLAAEGYPAMLAKVRSYVPQTSIIGQLMGVPENYTVVHSSATGMSQHNPFTWGLSGPHFDTLPALDNTSKLIKATLDDFLTDSTPEQRALMVNTLFDVLGAANTHTFGEMADRWTDTAGALWDATWKLDSKTFKAVLEVLGSLASSGVDSAKKFIAANLDKPTDNTLAEGAETPALPDGLATANEPPIESNGAPAEPSDASSHTAVVPDKPAEVAPTSAVAGENGAIAPDTATADPAPAPVSGTAPASSNAAFNIGTAMNSFAAGVENIRKMFTSLRDEPPKNNGGRN